jgi:type VI secretion system protein ImpG
MDTRLLQYYERELRYLRELGAEFAQHFPKVAGRLGIAELECADPHVERLLEGFAFMAARVHMKLDAEFPRFTQQLMELVYPHYLAPTPSMAVVQFAPNPREGSLARGFVVPRDTALRARASLRDVAPCEYRTAHALELWPIEIESVEYTSVLRDLADLRIPSREPIKALLRVRLRTTGGVSFDALKLRALPLYLRGGDEISARLYEQLMTSVSALIMRWGPNAREQVALSSAVVPVRALGFDDEHALLPRTARSFSGYRLLQEYFAFPSRFDFVELRGLDAGAARCNGQKLEILLPLTRHDPVLEGAVDAGRTLLFATPAINLFRRSCDRLPLPERNHDLHIVPDRTRPLDFEVHTIERVTAYAPGSDSELLFEPMNGSHGRAQPDGTRAHYSLERRPHVLSLQQRRTGSRTPYSGSEVFLTLAEPGPRRSGLRQLGVDALCTNRDLPLLLALGQGDNDFTLQSGAPVDAVRCVAGPTAPRATPLDGDLAWRLVSHLSLNYLSMSRESGGGEAVREMLGLYAQLGDPLLGRQVEGIRGVRSSSIVRPMPGTGPRAFVRGLEVALDCEEQAFSGHGVFTLASVLSAFFAKHASINSFTETVLSTRERGEVFRWPTTAGLRHTL